MSRLEHRDVAEAFLFLEARLLDGRRYEEWLDLLTDDCLYWVPAETSPGDPSREAGVHFDDKRRLLDRVALIRTGHLHAQTPPTRTCRMIGNVETWPEKGSLEIRSCLTLWAYRQECMTAFAGTQEHLLTKSARQWRVKRKVIRLLNCDQPLGNITFIL